jgi:hypothetical protein
MLGWILVAVGYCCSILFFHILGGLASASDAIQSWGRSSAERAVEKSGLSPNAFARSRVSRS